MHNYFHRKFPGIRQLISVKIEHVMCHEFKALQETLMALALHENLRALTGDVIEELRSMCLYF